jgi:hypothetical protein
MGGNLGKCDKREVTSGQTRKGGGWPTEKDKRGQAGRHYRAKRKSP